MSRLGRSPRWLAVAALAVCLAPASFGQNLRQSNISASWAVVSSLASAIPAKLTLPATVALSEPLKYGGDDHKKRKKGGGGTSVPEGGSPLVYLGLAGLVCLSAILFSRRRSHTTS
jgi:hypothetical protein